MLQQVRKLKNDSRGAAAAGITIIEVMIVLAVAGLIMAIVFLAVPALQRNARNSQRSADASRVLAAVGDCLSNKNGQVTSCQSTAAASVGGYYDATRNQQLSTVNIGAGVPAIPAAGTTNTFNVGYGAKCNAAGDGLDATPATPRQYAGFYRAETQSGDTVRCIGG